MAVRVLVVEDDPPIAELVVFHLGRAGFESHVVGTGAEALREFDRLRPEVVILDLMLPDGSGWDVCRAIRARGDVRTAVIMLTALAEEADRVSGLEMGADDYVTKPFSPRELVARVRAVLRRPSGGNGGDPEDTLRAGQITIDRRRVTALANGDPLPLTATEFKILAVLASAHGQVKSRDELLDAVWGEGFFGDRRTVDVHIRHIRAKLDVAGAGDALQTVRGFGYRLRAEGTD